MDYSLFLLYYSIPMKAPIIPTQFSLLFSSILQKNVSIYGIVSVVSVANYTACFEEHSWELGYLSVAISDSASILTVALATTVS